MESLIKALPALLKASGAPEEVAEAACVAMWKHAVGEALSSHTLPVQLREQKLTIVVDDNLWKKQLEQMRAQLLFRLNAVLGQSVVKSIELRIDPKTLAASRPAAPESHAAFKRAAPTELLGVAAAIDDQDLRRAFLGAATSCLTRLEIGNRGKD